MINPKRKTHILNYAELARRQEEAKRAVPRLFKDLPTEEQQIRAREGARILQLAAFVKADPDLNRAAQRILAGERDKDKRDVYN